MASTDKSRQEKVREVPAPICRTWDGLMILHISALLLLLITESLLWYYLPFAWPDKLGICVAWLIVAFAIYLFIILFNGLPPTADRFGANDWNYLITGVIKNEMFVAAPIWVAARLVDFLIGGPAKRKLKRNPT